MRLLETTLLALFLVASPGAAQGADPSKPRGAEVPLPPPPKGLVLQPGTRPDLRPSLPVDPAQAALRSLLLPGLGQIQSERPVRGGLFMGAALASLGGTVYTSIRAKQALDIYNGAPMGQREATYLQADRAARDRNLLIGTTVVVWALSVADAYYFHPERR
jgi:hypothetical protein